MSPRKKARFPLGSLVWFWIGEPSWSDSKKLVGTVVGTWEWSPEQRQFPSTKINVIGSDPRTSSEARGYLVMPSDPGFGMKRIFFADISLGRCGIICVDETKRTKNEKRIGH